MAHRHALRPGGVGPGPRGRRQAARRVSDHPAAGRVGKPADSAGTIACPASPSADYISGQVIHVNQRRLAIGQLTSRPQRDRPTTARVAPGGPAASCRHLRGGTSLYEGVEDEPALAASLGCGVPTAVADLHEGETMLDLGSGADATRAARADRQGHRPGHDRRNARARRARRRRGRRRQRRISHGLPRGAPPTPVRTCRPGRGASPAR